MRLPLLVASLSALVSASCGGSSAEPTPVSSSIEIMGPSGYLLLGQTYQFQMEVRLRDGSRLTTGGVWGSDAPTVATVDGNGVVRVTGIGEGTLWVEYLGQRGTKRIRTTGRYEGRLGEARVRVTRCTHTGWWRGRGSCGSEQTHATFTQQDNMVTAAFTLVWDSDSFNETRFPPVTVAISPTGELAFESAEFDPDNDSIVGHWRLRLVGVSNVAGTFTIRVTEGGRSGFLEWETIIEPTPLVRPAAAARQSVPPPVVPALARTAR